MILKMVGFEGIVYVERRPLFHWLGRKRTRQDIEIHRIGDSLVVYLPPPVAWRVELTTTPGKFAELVGQLCAAQNSPEKT